MPSSFKKLEEGFLNLRQRVAPLGGDFTDEAVLVARGIATRLSFGIERPEGSTATLASLALEALSLENGDAVDIPHVHP